MAVIRHSPIFNSKAGIIVGFAKSVWVASYHKNQLQTDTGALWFLYIFHVPLGLGDTF